MSIMCDKTEFERLLDSSRLLLADFFAEWCSPCKMLAPVVDEIKKEYEKYFVTVKVNVDKNPKLSEYYGISGIPTLLLFKNGKEIMRMTGYQTKESIISAICEKTGEQFV